MDLRVLQVAPFYDSQLHGGTERYVSQLVPYLASRGIDAHVLTTDARANPSLSDHVRRLRSYKVIWNINPLVLDLQAIADEISKGYDVIHIHGHLYLLSLLAAIEAKRKKTPALLQIHGGIGLPPIGTPFIRRVVKAIYDRTVGTFALNMASALGSVSMTDMLHLKSTGVNRARPVIWLPNAIDLMKFPRGGSAKRSGSDHRVISFVGDLEPWKGAEVLLQLIQDMSAEFPHTMNVVGSGRALHAFKRLGREKPFLNVLGAQSHEAVLELMRQTDVLLCPSLWEGLPTTLLEAMAAGAIVIATPLPEIRRLIHEGKTGFLALPESQSLKAKLDEVLSLDSTTLDKIRLNARQLVERDFSFETVASRITLLYERLSRRK